MRTAQAHPPLVHSGRTAVAGAAALVLRQGAYSSPRPDDPLAVSCRLPHAQVPTIVAIQYPPDKTGDTASSQRAPPRPGSASLAGAVVPALPALARVRCY